MSEKGESSTNEPNNDINSIFSKYKHVPPRLSDDWYQAEVPEYNKDSRPNFAGSYSHMTYFVV